MCTPSILWAHKEKPKKIYNTLYKINKRICYSETLSSTFTLLLLVLIGKQTYWNFTHLIGKKYWLNHILYNFFCVKLSHIKIFSLIKMLAFCYNYGVKGNEHKSFIIAISNIPASISTFNNWKFKHLIELRIFFSARFLGTWTMPNNFLFHLSRCQVTIYWNYWWCRV